MISSIDASGLYKNFVIKSTSVAKWGEGAQANFGNGETLKAPVTARRPYCHA